MKGPFTLMAALATVATLATACVERSTNILIPSEIPGATAAPASPSYLGTWASDTPGLPSPNSCSNFQWQITSQTPSSLSGTFSGSCAGGLTISGTASGQLQDNLVPITVTGTATFPGVASCAFSLSGTGVLGNDALTIPYTGTTCLGPVQGTQVLHRPASPAPAAPPQAETPAPPPPPPPPPPDPLFGCGGITDNLALVTCIHSAIKPTDAASSFEVTKRVAWALRGQGAGLMIKNGGENVVWWRGYSFSAARIEFADCHYVKILSDVGPGGVNAPSWQEQGLADCSQYVPAIDPTLP